MVLVHGRQRPETDRGTVYVVDVTGSLGARGWQCGLSPTADRVIVEEQ